MTCSMGNLMLNGLKCREGWSCTQTLDDSTYACLKPLSRVLDSLVMKGLLELPLPINSRKFTIFYWYFLLTCFWKFFSTFGQYFKHFFMVYELFSSFYRSVSSNFKHKMLQYCYNEATTGNFNTTTRFSVLKIQ